MPNFFNQIFNQDKKNFYIMKIIKYKYLEFLFFSILYFLCLSFYYQIDKGMLLENNYFPWDSHYYYQMALEFRENNGQISFKYPFNERVLFPFLTSLISQEMNLSLTHSFLFLNLLAVLLLMFLIQFSLEKFNVKFFGKFFIIFLFLTSFIMPLRLSIYYPGSNFAFDTLILSTIITTLYLQIKNDSKVLYIFSIFLSIIGTSERGILILMIYLVPLIFFYIFKKKINTNKFKLKKQKVNFSTYAFFSIITLLAIKKFGFEGHGNYSMFTEIISSIQFQANIFEFFYKFYYCFGVFFILIVHHIVKKFLDNKNKITLFNKLNIENFFIISVFLNSIIFSTIGGRGDVDRFLLWFLLPYLVLTGIIFQKLIKEKKFKKIIFLIFIIGIIGGRIYIPAWPPVAFSNIFVQKNHINTNFRDELFKGPSFMKKFKNKTRQYYIGKDNIFKNVYLIEDQEIIQFVEIPDGQYFEWAQYRNYIHAYKYRINDIPFPLGYIHNQRNALIDHPYHGHRIIRFLLVIQWMFLQFMVIFYLYKKKFFNIFS